MTTPPLLPVDLLRIPIFALSIATSIASFCGQMLAFTALPFYLQSRFGYCFVQPKGSGYPPIANLHLIPEPFAPLEIQGAGGPLPVQPFAQTHGAIRSLGFRFGPIAYSPDVNKLDDAAFAALDGAEAWIVDALRHKPHPSHAHVGLALEWLARVRPRLGVLTNLHQDLDYEALKAVLPAGVAPAYDGLSVRAEI